MKTNYLPTAALLLAALPAFANAQAVPVTPTTPSKFATKPVGSATGTTGASINPPALKPVVRKVTTYLTLSDLRQWNSTDGQSRMGKLIAWEETVTTGTGTASPAPQSAPITSKPTVLKENKARLLIENKAYEVPLDRLGAEEQKFIKDLQTALAAKP